MVLWRGLAAACRPSCRALACDSTWTTADLGVSIDDPAPAGSVPLRFRPRSLSALVGLVASRSRASAAPAAVAGRRGAQAPAVPARETRRGGAAEEGEREHS